MRYNVIILVEAIMSLALHILTNELGIKPSSYVEAIEELSKRIGVKCVEDLKALVRLRNLLIHRYCIIDDKKVYKSVKENFKCVEELVKIVEEEYGG